MITAESSIAFVQSPPNSFGANNSKPSSSAATFERRRDQWLRQVNADSRLLASDAKVALALALHFNRERGGEAWPKVETLAAATAMSTRTVIRAIKNLETTEHLRVFRSKTPDGKRRNNRYAPIIRLGDKQDDHVTSVVTTGQPCHMDHVTSVTVPCDTGVQNHVTPVSHKLLTEPPKEEPPKKNIAQCAIERLPIEDLFEQFWAAYPKKVGKGRAKPAFIKALKKTTLPEILKALEWQKAKWTDPQYIPHPASWLNGERWLDDPNVATAANGAADQIMAALEQAPRGLTRPEILNCVRFDQGTIAAALDALRASGRVGFYQYERNSRFTERWFTKSRPPPEKYPVFMVR
jgi:hypothetical protein